MDKINTESILENLFDGVYYVDKDRRISYWNKGAERISGYPREEVLGSFCFANILRHTDKNGKELCEMGCPLQATINDGKSRENIFYLHHKDGHRVPVHVRVSPLRNEAGEIIGGVEIFNDMSKDPVQRELSRYIEKANIDPLLGICNRRYAKNLLQNNFYKLKKTDQSFGVIFIDLDDFKQINDQYGHEVGDQVLRMVCKSVPNGLRKADILVRWGGDEFLVILPDIDEESLSSVIARVDAFINSSFIVIEGEKIGIHASMGAVIAQKGDTQGSLIKRADQAMYEAKKMRKRNPTHTSETH